jgi:hypothetical protein
MSGDRQRLHRVRGVSSGSIKFLGWSTKPRQKTEEQQHQTGLTGVRQRLPDASKRRTRVGIARLASRLRKFAVTGHPSDGATTKIPKVSFGSCMLV